MKKYRIDLGYLTKLGKYKVAKSLEISATDNDDAINQMEANLRNYRGKTKAKRIYGFCINEELAFIKTKYYDL